jgi:hypothetical protein
MQRFSCKTCREGLNVSVVGYRDRDPLESADATAHREAAMEHGQGYPVPVQSPYKARDLSSPMFVEIWLVSAVATILGVRLYLELTGYPQVGGSTLHIAHMLWGGLGMVISFGILLVMASAVWKPAAAMIGGIGFGLFIDELGKFITKDNDYFYQPTIALIYAIFVVLFLVSRTIDRVDKVTQGDHVLYAIQCVEQLAIGRLDEDGRQAGLRHLEEANQQSPLTDSLREILEQADVTARASRARLLDWRDRAAGRYWKLVSGQWLWRLVVFGFILQAISFVGSLALATYEDRFDITNGLSFSESGALISGLVAGALAVYGLVMIVHKQRLRGLKALANSTLVTLLFGQFFAFAASQFAALGTLTFQLIVLGVLRFWITSEKHTHPSERSGLPAAEIQAIEDSGTEGARA